MNRKSATFGEFKDYTVAVARGERMVDPSEPKVWCEQIEGGEPETSADTSPANSDYFHSVLRERIVEHLFVGEALRLLWEHQVRDIEVLRSEFDIGGYDLVMSCRGVVRHIQFKSVTEGGKAKSVSVNLKLKEKPSGCVIWVVIAPRTLKAKSYRWLGGEPGERLPDDISELKKAKKPTGTKLEKPNHRVVPARRFEKLDSMNAVLDRLFGPLP